MYTNKFKLYLQDINKIYNINKPLFSVIMPLYNKEKYIKRAINSVLNQTYKNFEIIVVNDGSTDNSLSIVRGIKDKRIKIFDRKKNNGPHFARNFGISKSKGKFIAFLDGDDAYKPFFLMTIVKLMFKYQNFKIYSTSFKKVYTYASNERTFCGEKKDCVINNFINETVKNKNFMLHLSSMVIEKKLLKKVGCFVSSREYKKTDVTGEDVDLFVRLSMYCDKIAYSNITCSIYYRNSKFSASKTKSKNFFNFKFIDKTFAKKRRMVKTKEEKEIVDDYKYLFYESIILQLILKTNFALAKKVLKKIPVEKRKNGIVKMLKIQEARYLLTNNLRKETGYKNY